MVRALAFSSPHPLNHINVHLLHSQNQIWIESTPLVDFKATGKETQLLFQRPASNSGFSVGV